MSESHRTRSELIPVALVVAAALAAYLPTVAPTVTWLNGGADGGDLASAVLVAGIPHPPGYPTYMLEGLLWMLLPLPGDAAHRLALMSAVGAALASGVTAATTLRLAASASGSASQSASQSTWTRWIGGVYSGLTLAWSPLLWSQAAICEVYAPGLLWLTVVGFVLLPGLRGMSVRRAVAAAGIGGVGFGALPQIALAGPGAVILVLARLGLSASTMRCLCWCVVAAGVGLLTFVYLPLRASHDPTANWGDPTSTERFLNVVTTAEYRYVVGMIGPGDWLVRVREGLYRLGQNLVVIGLGLALFATQALWSRLRAEIVYLASLLVLTLVIRAAYPVADSLVYLIPSVYAGTILAGLGLARLLDLLGHRLRREAAWLAAGMVLAISLGSAVLTAPRVDASDDRTALNVGTRLLDSAPPRALLLSQLDETTFVLWYVQAMGSRPDVVVIDRRLLLRDWYREQLERRHPEITFDRERNLVVAPDRPRLTIDGPPQAARLRPLD